MTIRQLQHRAIGMVRCNMGEIKSHCTINQFIQVWGALSQCPELLQQHSRTVVPLFLGFLQYQYLGDRAFPDDSETRAVEIASHLTPLEQASEGPGGWGPVVKRGDGRQSAITESAERTADRRSVRGRLGALLEVFSAASGPKSLYKQRVLFRVYRALLVMPDEKIAGLALRCMLSYKPPFLVPYKVRRSCEREPRRVFWSKDITNVRSEMDQFKFSTFCPRLWSVFWRQVLVASGRPG